MTFKTLFKWRIGECYEAPLGTLRKEKGPMRHSRAIYQPCVDMSNKLKDSQRESTELPLQFSLKASVEKRIVALKKDRIPQQKAIKKG